MNVTVDWPQKNTRKVNWNKVNRKHKIEVQRIKDETKAYTKRCGTHKHI